MIIACLATTTMFASCEKEPDNGNKPTDGEDVEFTIYVNGKDSWIPFAGKTGVTFTNSDNGVLSITDNGTKVEFTGKQVGNSTITAKLGEETLKALVRVRAAEGGETKKYFTYDKPVTAFFIEFNGGTVDTKLGSIFAYENKKMASVSYNDFWLLQLVWGSNFRENLEAIYNKTGSMEWAYPDQPWDDWLCCDYKAYIFPLSNFGDLVVKNLLLFSGGLWEMYENSPSEMPNKVDITQWYVRSEKVMNIMCDVFEYKLSYEYDYTYWVDPSTGFTLKYKEVRKSNNQVREEFEVTKLIIGSPDWDGEHLHPKTGDTYLN
jgi:hypothetical protein